MATQKTKRILLLLAAIVIAAALIAGYLLWNAPHKDVRDASSTEVTASDLYHVFITDSIKARKLYIDKVLTVSGEVAQVSVNQQAQQVILLQTGVSGAFINCTMEQKPAETRVKDMIRIKAICIGYISGDADMGLPGDVFLIRGYLLK